MGSYYGADLDETPRWRLSILFLIIVVLSVGAHYGLHGLQEYFRKHKRVGLKHTLHTLEEELFALGLITLLLIAFQEYVLQICVDGNSGGDDYYAKGRRLLAKIDFKCPEGQESFWSLTALHEIHILIFLIAVVHLLQAGLSMIFASQRVKRWKSYEYRSHDMIPLKNKGAIKAKGSWIVLGVYSFFAQFTNSVDRPAYLAIRRFFIEKMELDDNFNFYTYVVDSMEEDFAKLVHFQWVMWLIAAIWIVIPWEAHIIIWLPCVLFVVMLIIGGKLQSVAIQIATLAYTHYTPNFIPRKNRRSKSILKKSASKIKDILGGASQKHATDTAREQPGAMDIEANKSKQSSVAEYMAQTELLHDSSSLFWFGKPKLIVYLFQYVYFVSGLAISLLILDEWRDQRINHLTGHAMYIVMIVVNILMMIHAAIFVIPIYAITVAAGAYGPDNILKKALKRNINADLARKLDLERKSCGSVQESDMGSVEDTADSHYNHGHGHDHDDDGHSHGHGHDDHGHGHGHGGEARINMLLEAMDHSQARKKKMEETPTSTNNKIGSSRDTDGHVSSNSSH